MMNIKKIASSLALGAAAVALGLGVQMALADWSAAPASPPSSNVPAPLNVGSSAQTKTGGLALGTSTLPSGAIFDANGVSWLNGLIVQGNFQLVDSAAIAGNDNGKVLTSDAVGNASWQSSAFMGMYMANYKTDGTTYLSCRHANPATSGCSCPTGYTAKTVWDWNNPNGNYYNDNGADGVEYLFQCYKSS